MQPSERQFLSVQACKYLKHLAFSYAASPLTFKSYATDLAQFLSCDAIKKFYKDGDSELQGGTPKWHSSNSISAILMKQIRESQILWQDLSPASRQRKWACVRGFLKWLLQEDIIQQDLTVHVGTTKVPERIPHFLSVDEAYSLIGVIRQSPLNAAGVLFLLLYGGGLRISEACQLKWSDILTNERCLRVLGKGQKERVVAVPHFVAAALEDWRSAADATWVVGTEAPLTSIRGYRMIQELGKLAGLLKPLHPHALRHSYATHMLASGSDLRILQELLGHSSLKSTQRYTHLDLDQLANTLASFHPLSNLEKLK